LVRTHVGEVPADNTIHSLEHVAQSGCLAGLRAFSASCGRTSHPQCRSRPNPCPGPRRSCRQRPAAVDRADDLCQTDRIVAGKCHRATLLATRSAWARIFAFVANALQMTMFPCASTPVRTSDDSNSCRHCDAPDLVRAESTLCPSHCTFDYLSLLSRPGHIRR